ncbi:MAG: amidohydrolase [Bryobacteraceae bacterium]|nr:amidohydrolase [Bryobacteraceae bacterium]
MILILLGLGLVAGALYGQEADLVVTNANIYTVDPARPRAKALAVRGGRIIAVGDDVSAHSGPKTQRLDLRGATVVPGFIDSHVHMRGLGTQIETFDLRNVKTIAGVADIVRQAAASRPPGEWITGRAWDQTNWGGEFPTSDPLTAAAPNHPVFLTRVDGHAGWANRRALEAAGITRDTPDPAGGKILRDAAGTATGVLIDRAQGLVGRKIPAATDEVVRRRIEKAALECARLGLTSVHDAGVPEQDLQAYRALIEQKKLPVRVYAMIGGETPLWQAYLRKGPEIGEQLTVRSIKLVADGALGSRGAALWQGYTDEKSNTGLLILLKDDIERVARAAVKAGFQVNTHAIGDKANRIALDAYAAALGGKNDRRFRIEHAQVVSLPDFALFQQNSVIASIQATHATSDMRWAHLRLGPDRLQGAYAWKRFLKMGIPIANGSDFPVEDANPLWGFYSSVSRQDHQGQPPGGWRPEDLLTRGEALHSWTLAGAYAAFEEQSKGSLAPGKLADFVVLSKDIMTVPAAEILKTKVTMTVRGGEVVYREGR